MARQVQISTATPSVEATPQTSQYDAMQDLAGSIQKGINLGAELFQRSEKALTSSQLEKNGAILNSEWKLFNNEQKLNYNQNKFDNALNGTYQTQLKKINEDGSLTVQAKNQLLKELDLHKKIAQDNFEANRSYAMTSAALKDKEETIGMFERAGDINGAVKAIDDGVASGLYHENLAENMKKQSAINVSFYRDRKVLEDATDIYSINQKLEEIGDRSDYSDAQRSQLLSIGSAQQRALQKEEKDYEDFIEARFSDKRITQDMIDQIKDPYARETYQALFDADLNAAEGKLVETGTGKFKLYVSHEDRMKGDSPLTVKMDTLKQADIVRDNISTFLSDGEVFVPTEDNFDKDGNYKGGKLTKYTGEEAYRVLQWNIQASDAEPQLKQKWLKDLRQGKGMQNGEKFYQPRPVGPSDPKYKSLMDDADKYLELLPETEKVGELGSIRERYDALIGEGKTPEEASDMALRPLREKDARLRISQGLMTKKEYDPLGIR